MDVRIGVVNTPKEITVELADDTDVEALVSDVESASHAATRSTP